MPDVAACVVAWHNRHPLARRLTPADIGQVGVVALPFAVPQAAVAADMPVTGGADEDRTRPLFGADWMYRAHRTMAARLSAWVRAHGEMAPDAFDGWPRRQIAAELPLSHRADADGLTGRTLRHVLSTVIEAGGQRTRVLVAPRARDGRAAVYGNRQWSVPRLFTAAGLVAGSVSMLVALVAGTTFVSHPRGAQPGATLPLAMAAGPATADADADAESAARHRAEPAEPPRAEAALPAARGPALPAAPSAPASTPLAAAAAAASPPGRGAGPTDHGPSTAAHGAEHARTLAPAGSRAVDVRPRLSVAERQAAREASGQARVARATEELQQALAGFTTPPTTPPGVAGVPAGNTPRTAASAASPPSGTAVAAMPAVHPIGQDGERLFAIATRPLPSRVDAQAQEALMRGLVASQATPYRTQLELMQAQGRWRAVWWPHPDREFAEGLLLLARQRGLRVDLIEF